MQVFQLVVYFVLALSLYCVHAAEPIPRTAFPVNPPDPIKGYTIVDHGNGVYYLTEGAYWSMAVVSSSHVSSRDNDRRGRGRGRNDHGRNDPGRNDHGRNDGRGRGRDTKSEKTLLLIDAPTGFFNESSFNAMLRELVQKSRTTRITDFIYSHSHTDHIGMAYLVKKMYRDVKIHASTPVCERLRHKKDSRRPLPTNCYRHNFTLPNYGVAVHDIGDGHSVGNRAIYHAKSKTLMYIDIVFPGWSMFKELAQAEYVPDFYEAHDKILQYDFNVYVGGHLTRLGNRQDVLIQKEYVGDIIANAKFALSKINWGLAAEAGTFDPTSPNYLNYWYLWDVVQGDMINICTERTLAKWDHLLGAVDINTPGHCFKAIESEQID
jgi:glyoxylase-like metal-dependent hydrolase (beta-lactamase superfamily II)